MTALYSLRGITRSYGNREVLHIDSLDIQPGDIHALLGANGAGKSTLMRILAFLDSPSSGELYFKGEKVFAGQEARHRPGVVWVPQFPVMFTGSLLYNIEYPMALKKIPPQERKKRAVELLESVTLGHLAKAPAHKLSGGEAQRASIARALAAGVEIILFDEPTANVDQRAQDDFMALVRSLRERRGLSICITTHNAAMAAALCRKQIFLVEGKLVRQHVLPDGSVAWPGKLAKTPEGFHLCVTPDAVASFSPGTPGAPGAPGAAAPGKGVVRGVADFAAGVTVRLELSPGRMVEFLLEDTASRDMACSLALNSPLAIHVERDTLAGGIKA
ncbi:putative Phosphonate-transporting ATPase [uncultured delta proteobacterium]|uniref:Putative Phosphonate-transporting ATPase n=1 Tax=uncultured delta proteobacterium TaxID=34034 RepID=A0A212K9P2_9DELT|nr:putative Phosphonate-transporting ATPase [uncultured delta proteobacterium]